MSEIINHHILGMVSISQLLTERSYNILCPGRDDWKRSDSCISLSDLAIFMDGSKLELGTGARVAGTNPRVEISVNRGRYTTIFQAEMIATHRVETVRELKR